MSDRMSTSKNEVQTAPTAPSPLPTARVGSAAAVGVYVVRAAHPVFVARDVDVVGIPHLPAAKPLVDVLLAQDTVVIPVKQGRARVVSCPFTRFIRFDVTEALVLRLRALTR